MSVPGASNPLLLSSAAGGAAVADIERSLRFNSGDSAYLSSTASAGSNTTWTLSTWVKKTGLDNHIFGAGTGNVPGRFGFGFDGSDKIFVFVVDNSSTVYSQNSDAVFRDPSAWYHIVVVADTTNTTPDDRLIVYVNGVRQSLSGGAMPLNQNTFVNTVAPQAIGRRSYTASDYFNGYLADFQLIDGTASDIADLGQYDETTNVWTPLVYSGDYGPNGFHLDFSDNSSASALGTDSSGNGNNFTVTNIGLPSLYTFSDGWTANLLPGFPGTNCFNGTGTSLTIGGSSVVSTWTAPTSLPFSTLTIRGGHDGATIKINGTDVTSQFTSGLSIVTVTGISSPLSTIALDNSSGAGNARISSIVIDGERLVDSRPFPGNGNDSLFDSPTNGTQTDTGAGGEVSGNYCTWNPLRSDTANPSNGNLQTQIDDVGSRCIAGTISVTSGKWFWEITCISGNNSAIGVSNSAGALSTIGFSGGNSWIYYQNGGNVYTPSGTIAYGTGWTVGDVIGVALDMDNGTLAYYKNGSSQGTAVSSGLSGKSIEPLITNGGGNPNVNAANFGQRAFAYTAPSGFKALCTANLTDPSIVNSSTVMGAVAYDGTGTSQTITLPGTGFDPDMVWIKRRDQLTNYSNAVQDQVRGYSKGLITNRTDLEYTYNAGEDFTGFTTGGFSLGTPFSVDINNSPGTYVAWAWDFGTTTGSNSDGSAVSQVRKNLSAGISIMTASPSGAAETMGHGLGLIPNLIISKRTDASSAWYVRTSFLANPPQQYLILNSDAQLANDASAWANTAADASVITVNATYLYGGACDLVHYCFVAVNGFSAFGTYDGNSSADGPFVHCGFRPRYLMVKAVNGIRDWMVWDSARVNYNVNNATLSPNRNLGEQTPGFQVDLLSNGFKLRASTLETNNSAYSYLYCAFAENPFKYTRAV